MARLIFYRKSLVWAGLMFCLAILILAACSRGGKSTSTPAAAPSTGSPASPGVVESSPSPSPILASPTPPALAARVGDLSTGSGKYVEVTQAEYEAELALYRAAKGTDLAPEDEQHVLEDLTDQAILAQAAFEQGFTVGDALLQERLQRLQERLGGEGPLADWMKSYGYDEDTFRRALTRAIASAWMRDQIAASTPRTAEQVHVRQILLYNSDQADEVYTQLKAGNDFGNLAVEYDPVTQGDLGWFPRGYLPDKKLEEAAFALQPEQFSPVIQTSAGYHILQVIERDAQHPLSPEALLILQTQAVQSWLQERRSLVTIEVLLP